MKLGSKIKAGALQFVLFIGAVIAILLMCFVLISHIHNFFNKKTDVTVAVIQKTDFGLRYAFEKEMKENSVLEIPPPEDSGIKTVVKKAYWGLFEKYTSTAEHNNTVFNKVSLVGKGIKNDIAALYLTDRQRPLIIAGDAKINGNAYLPKQGIRMGNISGNSYRHQRLVYGAKRSSRSTIPPLNSDLFVHLEELFENRLESEEEIPLKPNSEIRNSFLSPTKSHIGSNVTLENIKLIGNIIISASDRIFVEPSAVLHDIILIAPEIIVKNGVKGSFQTFAKNKLSVGKRCELSYPTVLAVLDKNSEKDNTKDTSPKIHIASESFVDGVVLYLDESSEQKYFPQIKISERATVRGEVYCTENLELKGTVLGKVTTDGFIAMENGSIYQNHLYNGHIDNSRLPKKYVGLAVGQSKPNEVMKWLY